MIPKKTYPAEFILLKIESFFNVERDYVFNKSRDKERTRLKRMSRALLRRWTDLTLKQIALIGMNDHSTVVYSIRIHGYYMEQEEDYRCEFEALEQSLFKDIDLKYDKTIETKQAIKEAS